MWYVDDAVSLLIFLVRARIIYVLRTVQLFYGVQARNPEVIQTHTSIYIHGSRTYTCTPKARKEVVVAVIMSKSGNRVEKNTPFPALQDCEQ